MVDTSGIHTLIARGRRRLRVQAALEAATTASILAIGAAVVAVYLVRLQVVSSGAGVALLLLCPLLVLGAAAVAAARPVPVHVIATRIDRASGLSDRLATACAFEQALAGAGEGAPAETVALMEAAVRDAIRAAPRADVAAATPFAAPIDTRPALAFAVVGALVAGRFIAPPDNDPHIAAVVPQLAVRGATVTLEGSRFCGPRSAAVAGDGTCRSDAARLIQLGLGEQGRTLAIETWRADRIAFAVPHDAPLGKTHVLVGIGDRRSEPADLEIVDAADQRLRAPGAEPLAEEDLDYARSLLAGLERTAREVQEPHLLEFVKEVKELLSEAELGTLTREQLLEQLAQAESRYMEGSDEDIDQTLAHLRQTGRELSRDQLTRELGKALEQGDLGQAREEMEKLAEKLDSETLSEREREQLARALERAADQFEKQDRQQDERAKDRVERAREEARRLQRKRDEAVTEQERDRLSRQVEKKERELQRLEREQQQREQSAQRRSLKRLHRNMQKASEQLRQRGEKSQRQAARNMRDAAEETGRVESDVRKINTQQRVASQVTDLREAMRRARQQGNRGPQDMFGRNQRRQDFQRRAQGQGGQRDAWRPGQRGQQGQQGQGQQGRLGQGQQPGQGQQGNQPGGQGQQPGGDSYGDGHDPNLLGEQTARSGNVVDEGVSGVHGRGPSRRETILSAAQKGFASRAYEQVYAEYQNIVEEVMRTEKVPSGYKYYVKRYFQRIKPHAMD